ncbi:hypothetical protein HV169_10150 [Citrobacter freundii]|jgi:hypothetical protein|uniref:hypothetical protein n=1 Tax=Citrobacter freundii TaxID=546 RepID=UPI00143F5423|nr:hypothetical protein [Citrobacter freundii]MBA7729444.1 hypothetical protein [Citrobacter freundii]QLS06751.1 hypothetical protein HV327_14650 [Citrobacter freundii]
MLGDDIIELIHHMLDTWLLVLAIRNIPGVTVDKVLYQHCLNMIEDAQKQRRFPRSAASDIGSLLRQRSMKGPAASLLHRLEYLWSSCIGPLPAQSYLYRLTYAIERLKSEDWVNSVVSDRDWGVRVWLKNTVILLHCW